MQGWNTTKQSHGDSALGGFSLIEVLIVVAIIGILGAISYPSYLDYMTKTRRSDGQLALLQAIQDMERCKATNYSYTDCTLSTSTSPEGHYTLSLTDQTATAFKAIATAAGPQASDTECAAMSINQQGARTPAASKGCWPD